MSDNQKLLIILQLFNGDVAGDVYSLIFVIIYSLILITNYVNVVD